MTGGVTVGEQRKTGVGTTFVLPLTFSPLLTFHGGEYTCQSTVGVGAVEKTAMSTIIVESKQTIII